MIVEGVLRDLTGQIISQGLIQIIATATSNHVLKGSNVHIKCDSNGAYSFELLNGSYKLYAQPSRCSDLEYLGETVITTDTVNGDLNSIAGITRPVLPPQVQRAVDAATQSALSAIQAKAEKEKLLAVAAIVKAQVSQVTYKALQASNFSQHASDNANDANVAKLAAVVAKDESQKYAIQSANHKTIIESIKNDIVEINIKTESHANSAHLSEKLAVSAQKEAFTSAKNAASQSQQSFKAAIEAQDYKKAASGYADKAEQSLASTAGVLDSINVEVAKAQRHSQNARVQAVISSKAKESATKAQINSNTSAVELMRLEVLVDQALDNIIATGKLATESIEKTKNNRHGADLAAKEAAKSSQQAYETRKYVTQKVQVAEQYKELAKDSSINAANAQKGSQQFKQESQHYSEKSIIASQQAEYNAIRAEKAQDLSLESVSLASKVVDATRLTVVGVAKDLITTQKIIISFHPIN
ncbi:hypothetical protein C0W42_19780 [Photobacterium kishitanii]|uniref:hypothetical protein n=1 Tax=Photobacterium kishitanii TaxID=318456 RepID=UPI000D15403C|nr:hypothetical protein [Photobacterium kishitanii]PSU86658.1 hypothetical protein C0W42_19780 [Photobacterium kishitanii]